MGLIDDLDQVLAFRMAAPASDADVDRQLRTAQSWAGLTSQGRILISIEPRGTDIQTLVDHETVHDMLMRASAFGWLQILLAGLAEPPFPRGVTQRRARRLLAISIRASVRVQEACATFLPSLNRQGEDLDKYWAATPPHYREISAPLEWLRARDVSLPEVRHIVYGLGQVALCPPVAADWSARGLSDPDAWTAYLGDGTLNPNERFTTLARALTDASDQELTQLAKEWRPMLAALDEHWYPRVANQRAPYQAMPRDAQGHQKLVLEMAEAIVRPWIIDPTVPQEEKEHLEDARAGAFIPPIGETLLNFALTRTVAERGTIWDEPPLDWIMPYELAEILVNPAPFQVPGIERASGKGLPLSIGEGAVWLRSPRLPAAACRLSAKAVVKYLDRMDLDRTTLCVEDAGYLFMAPGVLPAPGGLRGRPHIVLVTHRSPHALLQDLYVQWGGSIGAYCTVEAGLPGASYLLIRPEHDRYPIVVMPLPSVSARRVAEVLERARHGPWPKAADLVSLVDDDPLAVAHVRRTMAMYEDAPWPEGEATAVPIAAGALEGAGRLAEAGRADDGRHADQGPSPLTSEDLSDYDRLIGLTRTLAWIDHSRAIEYSRMGRHKEALEEFSRAHQLDPNDPHVLANRGALYEQLGRYAEALADYNKSIRIDPGFALAYLNRGNAYRLLDRDEDALSDYTAAIERDGTLKEAYLYRAMTYGHLGRYTDALNDFDHLIQLDPDYAEAYSGRGLAYSALTEYDKALADLSRAIELDSSDANTYVRRGSAYKQLERYPLAIADYTRAIELQPDLVDAYNYRGGIYGNLRRYELALADFDRAIQLDPDDATLYYKHGMSQLGVNHIDQALADFGRAIQLDPTHAEAHYNIGVIVYNNGDPESALPYFERADTLGDPQAMEAVKRIRQELQAAGRVWDAETGSAL